MNISRENTDDLNAVIQIHLEPSDYQEKVDNMIEDYRKKAKLDGFRQGKVPTGLIRKMYGQAIMIDEVNKLLSESLNNFITENGLKILGEPIPNEDSPTIDWDKQTEFNFQFDIGLAPEFEINLSKKDKVPNFVIAVTDEMINTQVENYTRRFGAYETGDTAEADDLLKVDLVQVTSDEDVVENGISVEDTRLSITPITDQAVRDQLIGAKENDQFIVELDKILPNETDRATALKIDKSELSGINTAFRLTIREVSKFVPSEINQTLFDQVFGEGSVSSEDEFKTKVKETISQQLEKDSHYKFHLDAKSKLQSKIEISLPEEFLKRWMLLTNKDEKLTPEQLDKEFPAFAEDLKWQLIKNSLIEENELKATDEEVQQQAVQYAYAQYQQYGIYQVPQDQLISFAESILKNEDEKRGLIERILENKVIEHVRTLIKVDDKAISQEEFQKLFE